ncbi:MAG: aspartate-semialdehyde dehydrogenase [Candidatus Aegiribacteria sp.]|nr:aspartate-semialdehyde dehydrogenase [Candidatus Aegiribacteria sp.]
MPQSRYKNRDYPVEIIRPEAITKGMILFGATSANITKKWIPMCIEAGALIIDNSSAYRMDPDVLLTVPEVNGNLITGKENIIANPNCSTIQLVVALAPLLQLGRIKWVSVATYQAVSGAGTPALKELQKQQDGTLPVNETDRIHENIITSIGPPDAGGYCSEEMKLMNETCKIIGINFPVFASTARVPVRTGHTEAVVVKFDNPVHCDEAARVLEKSPGVAVSESGSSPLDVEGTDTVVVDRIRNNPADPSVLQFWVLADNLLKGAALNAVQIAEEYLRKKDMK